METLADIQLYGRSVEKCRMFYNPFIGGGDSLVYRELCKINLHGLTKLIEKEEDIRHIIKRLGSQLRNIVRYYKGNRVISITLISGHMKTALK